MDKVRWNNSLTGDDFARGRACMPAASLLRAGDAAARGRTTPGIGEYRAVVGLPTTRGCARSGDEPSIGGRSQGVFEDFSGRLSWGVARCMGTAHGRGCAHLVNNSATPTCGTSGSDARDG
jgi:hypothetical protein